MNRNEIHATSTEALPELLHLLLEEGEEVGSRNGRVKELTHLGVTLTDPTQRELIVPGRRPNLAAQIAESVWVLAGQNDARWLETYLPRALDFSDDGKTWRGGYGPRLRRWPVRDGEGVSVIDQLAHVVDLLRDDPLTRRAVINIYDPQVDSAPGKDIPCNNWLSFSSRLGKLDLHVAIRSNDAFWGWSGINAFEWSVLQEVVAGLLGIDVGSLHFSTTSFHLYDRHWKRAREIAERSVDVPQGRPSPRFAPRRRGIDWLDYHLGVWFGLEGRIKDGDDCAEEVDAFPEPMLRSWLRVLQWWWSGDRRYLEPLDGTRLAEATRYSVQPKRPRPAGPDGAETVDYYTTSSAGPVRTDVTRSSDFIRYAQKLHLEKHEAYGTSWKRRGEQMSIMANLARKVDRLGGKETPDETAADTALDLFVYLAKYRTWLEEKGLTPSTRAELGKGNSIPLYSDDPGRANIVMAWAESRAVVDGVDAGPRTFLSLERDLVHDFDVLTQLVDVNNPDRFKIVDDALLLNAYRLAYGRWSTQQWKDGNATRFWQGYEG